ncbi:Helicase C-terminal [Penicillium riverlandense]|uniref:Helicase C-terminal n=1 Tax=Penicillium riverlandense TaxID=1903569 RepID=UPI002546A1D4|nr:Helicase C-terminal [Penicillium riverlandense]KAJ5819027.1 Helicase C-terminal [Penicillium riverlandense]
MAGHKAASASSKKAAATESSTTHKRKRDVDATHTASTPSPTKKHKKRQSLSTTPIENDDTTKNRRKLKDALQGDDSPKKTGEESVVSPKRSKARAADSHDRVSEAGTKSKKNKRKTSEDDYGSAHETESVNGEPVDIDGADTKELSIDDGEPQSTKNKHSGILSKFERTKTVASAKAKKKPRTPEPQEEVTVEPVVAQGLEPLPQPENPPEIVEAPTYSSLPAWLANPLRTSAAARSKFADLGIKADLLRILEEHNYKEAFAVQSAVIPLLLQGKENHPGDLCISAATGSGKTLSYVVPMVTALPARPAPRLRGLIVVPTRELVKQARETCELCGAGSRLRIASAVGNVAIKDEQKLLMRMEQVYNPAMVEQHQRGLQENEWMDFGILDCIDEAMNSGSTLPGHIRCPETNVDILICTPGRLVDHIRYTKGFTLKHLEWLVIDEADRLLNESFQEWVSVVMDSLNERYAPDASGPAGKFFAQMGLPIETRAPQKVVLSATMTRDISKLNSLHLENPKMVIIGTEKAVVDEDPSATNQDANFTLPPTLHEHMVAVGDGSQKPLYLLRLLLSHINISTDSRAPQPASDTSDSDSDSDSSSSDDETSSDESSDDDTSSSGSDSDSDSDSSDSSSDESTDAEGSDDDTVALVPNTGPPRTTVLIFTKSSESASRLSRLLSILHPPLAGRVGTIIKSNKSSASRKTLTAFRRGQLSVIVATDRASRGLDLPSLTHVINYDVPTSATTYVHRVGRTARAGREGSAWTLVAHREGRWFANEISKTLDGRIVRASPIDRVQVKVDALGSLKAKYAAALDELEQEVRAG